jgi:hypothetical protein
VIELEFDGGFWCLDLELANHFLESVGIIENIEDGLDLWFDMKAIHLFAEPWLSIVGCVCDEESKRFKRSYLEKFAWCEVGISARSRGHGHVMLDVIW